jgi:hypothetical protein
VDFQTWGQHAQVLTHYHPPSSWVTGNITRFALRLRPNARKQASVIGRQRYLTMSTSTINDIVSDMEHSIHSILSVLMDIIIRVNRSHQPSETEQVLAFQPMHKLYQT